MSDRNFTIEGHIVNRLHTYLQDNSYNILQLVYPGGQCHISICYRNEDDEKKICYPDLIAFSSEEILLGEIKPRFDKKDQKKLVSIRSNTNNEQTIRQVITLHAKTSCFHLPIKYVLIHAQTTPCFSSSISQLILKNDIFVLYE